MKNWVDAKLTEAEAFRRLFETRDHDAWRRALRAWARAAEELRLAG